MWSEAAGHSRGACSANIRPPLTGDPRIKRCLKIFEDRIPQLLHQAIAEIPEEWYQDDIYMLYACLLWRLEEIRKLVDWEMLRTVQQESSQDGHSLEENPFTAVEKGGR
jgi:hypothetical protein